MGAALTPRSLPAVHKHPGFLAQLCFLPSWQKPWLWSVGIKLGICCSQVLVCCWNFHLCKITPEKKKKSFYLWCFIYLLFLWHVLQKFKNPPLFSCVYPACSQETVWLHTCLRGRREGSAGSQRLPPVQQMGATAFHLRRWSRVSKTLSYRCLQGKRFLLPRRCDGNACWLFSFEAGALSSYSAAF